MPVATRHGASDQHYLRVFVARQAIFDAAMNVAGHELLFRSCGKGAANVVDESSATANVIANGMDLVAARIGNKPAFINFPEKLLLEGAPLALKPESCVIEILETITPTKELLEILADFKNQGYTLALDDYTGQTSLAPFLNLADIVKVDVQGQSMAQVIKLTQKLRAPGRRLLAEKLEDRDSFELAKSLGFNYFQGFFFCKPVIEQGTSLKTHAVSRLRLLREISSEDYNVNKVAKIISQDAGLSYKLLSHLNTPHFAFRGKVHSLVQAVTLMGGRPLKQWLLLVMLADMGRGGRHDELVFASVCRAHFLELLARARPVQPYSPDTLFLVGLFSNLDALLHQPMSEITPHLPFDAMVTAALLGEKNPIRRHLELGILLEQGRWDHAAALMRELEVQQVHAAQMHSQAADWAVRMLDFDEAESNAA